MVDVKELRIGNWVLHAPPANNVNLVSHDNELKNLSSLIPAIRIEKGNVKVETLDGSLINGTDASEFEPIILSEDILRKSGFPIDKTSQGVLSIAFEGNQVAFITDRYGDLSHRNKVLYVHQLQNLYYELTREELNIQI